LTSTRRRFGCRGQGLADGEKVTAPSVCAGADRGNALNQTEKIQTQASFFVLARMSRNGNARSINANYIGLADGEPGDGAVCSCWG
jgi:hypothetical protein